MALRKQKEQECLYAHLSPSPPFRPTLEPLADVWCCWHTGLDFPLGCVWKFPYVHIYNVCFTDSLRASPYQQAGHQDETLHTLLGLGTQHLTGISYVLSQLC